MSPVTLRKARLNFAEYDKKCFQLSAYMISGQDYASVEVVNSTPPKHFVMTIPISIIKPSGTSH